MNPNDPTTTTPVGEPAIVQRMRQHFATVGPGFQCSIVLSSHERRELLSHLDRLASGTGEREQVERELEAVGLRAASRAAKAESDLATAKRELEAVRKQLERARAASVSATGGPTIEESIRVLVQQRDALRKELESARSRPVVPTGERPSDEELMDIVRERARYDIGVRSPCLPPYPCTPSERRALFDAGVARGISIGRGDLTRAVLTAETNLMAAKENERVARARADEAHLRAVEVLGIQTAEPKASTSAPVGYTDGTHGSIPKMGARDATQGTKPDHLDDAGNEKKPPEKCGRCGGRKLVESGTILDAGWTRCPDCKGTGEKTTAGPVVAEQSAPMTSGTNATEAARPIERLTREELDDYRTWVSNAKPGSDVRIDEPGLNKLIAAAERDLASAEKEGGEIVKAQEIWNDMGMPTLERVERVTGLLLDHLGAYKLSAERRAKSGAR